MKFSFAMREIVRLALIPAAIYMELKGFHSMAIVFVVLLFLS